MLVDVITAYVDGATADGYSEDWDLEKLWEALNDSNAPRGIDDRLPAAASSKRIMTAPYPTFTDRTESLTSEAPNPRFEKGPSQSVGKAW